jgi:hypothetical protein
MRTVLLSSPFEEPVFQDRLKLRWKEFSHAAEAHFPGFDERFFSQKHTPNDAEACEGSRPNAGRS